MKIKLFHLNDGHKAPPHSNTFKFAMGHCSTLSQQVIRLLIILHVHLKNWAITDS